MRILGAGTRDFRLTSAGTGLLRGSLVAGSIGVLSGYSEFVLLSVTGLVAVALAVVIPRLMSAISFERVNSPRLVARGNFVTFTLRATSERALPAVRVFDQLGGRRVPIEFAEIDPTKPTTVSYRIQALRRGVHSIGPVIEERNDPFALSSRSVNHGLVDELLVHPVIHRLRLPDGSTRQRHLQATRPTFSEDPLADFRSLREYVRGDDHRLVHWSSTARTGVLMVRDHLDLRRTTRTVILETLNSTLTAALFEEAVEIAASLVCESIADELDVTARTRDRRAPGSSKPIRSRHDALELFARVQPSIESDTIPAAQLRLGVDQGDQIFVVAAGGSPLIRQLMSSPAIAARLIVIRLDDGSVSLGRLNARHVTVANAEQFVARCRHGLVRSL